MGGITLSQTAIVGHPYRSPEVPTDTTRKSHCLDHKCSKSFNGSVLSPLFLPQPWGARGKGQWGRRGRRGSRAREPVMGTFRL